jgi:hypothetical protein
VRTIALDSTKKTAEDSMKYAWNTIGTKGLECAVTDMAGTIWKDTAYIAIVKDAPVVTMAYSPATIAVNDTIHIHMTAPRKYGNVVKVEWNFGNAGTFSPGTKVDSVIDTIAIAPSAPDMEYPYLVRVTDDDGNVIVDTLLVNVVMFVAATNSASFGDRSGHTSVVFDNKIWMIAGGGPFLSSFEHSDAWYSGDGISWLSATQQAPFPGRAYHTSLVFDNKLWVIGGAGSSSGNSIPMNDVWSSIDGSNWTQSTPSAQFSPRYGYASVVFDNKMWIIGGEGGNNTNYNSYYYYDNDVWYSTDGVTWIQATANAGFSPRSGHSCIVFNNMMWVIAGKDSSGPRNDVWFSSNGITWTQSTSSAAFSPRNGHSSVVFGNKMWVIAGCGALWQSESDEDAWYSTDGATWTLADAKCGFSPRSGHSSVVFGNKMWVIGGFLYSILGNSDSDVWYSSFSGK